MGVSFLKVEAKMGAEEEEDTPKNVAHCVKFNGLFQDKMQVAQKMKICFPHFVAEL